MKTIKEYRADLGLSVAEILELTGWSQSTYDRISNGQRELTPPEHFMLVRLPKKRGPKKRSGKPADKVIGRKTNICNGCLRMMSDCRCKPGGFQGVVSHV